MALFDVVSVSAHSRLWSKLDSKRSGWTGPLPLPIEISRCQRPIKASGGVSDERTAEDERWNWDRVSFSPKTPFLSLGGHRPPGCPLPSGITSIPYS